MVKVAGHILKGHSVKFEGQFRLDMAQAGKGQPPKWEKTASAGPQVRILENNPEYAVIEITCSCGTQTRLKCEYAAGELSAKQSGPHSQPQNEAFVKPEQISGRKK
jgi:hypothetical protein